MAITPTNWTAGTEVTTTWLQAVTDALNNGGISISKDAITDSYYGVKVDVYGDYISGSNVHGTGMVISGRMLTCLDINNTQVTTGTTAKCININGSLGTGISINGASSSYTLTAGIDISGKITKGINISSDFMTNHTIGINVGDSSAVTGPVGIRSNGGTSGVGVIAGGSVGVSASGTNVGLQAACTSIDGYGIRVDNGSQLRTTGIGITNNADFGIQIDTNGPTGCGIYVTHISSNTLQVGLCIDNVGTGDSNVDSVLSLPYSYGIYAAPTSVSYGAYIGGTYSKAALKVVGTVRVGYNTTHGNDKIILDGTTGYITAIGTNMAIDGSNGNITVLGDGITTGNITGSSIKTDGVIYVGGHGSSSGVVITTTGASSPLIGYNGSVTIQNNVGAVGGMAVGALGGILNVWDRNHGYERGVMYITDEGGGLIILRNNGAPIPVDNVILNGQTGNVRCVSLTQTSSRELKHNINPITIDTKSEWLNKLNDTNLYSYVYNFDESETKRIGVIAEESPDEMVGTDKKSFDMGGAIIMLIGAVQTLTDKVAHLESRLA